MQLAHEVREVSRERGATAGIQSYSSGGCSCGYGLAPRPVSKAIHLAAAVAFLAVEIANGATTS
jgi:hypothetical protein